MNPYLRVSEIMSVRLFDAPPETSISEAASMMRTHGIGSVLVTQGPRLLGIVTERDLVNAVAAQRDCKTTTLESIMTTRVVTVAPDSDILYAARIMAERGIRHLPVAEEELVIGLLSMRDILRWGMMSLAYTGPDEDARDAFRLLGAARR